MPTQIRIPILAFRLHALDGANPEIAIALRSWKYIGSRRTRHLALTGFESFCPAMAQGPSRLARGQAIASYVNSESFITLVPPVGRFGSGYRAVGRGSLVRALSLQLCDSSSGSVRDGDLGANIRRSVIV